MNLKEAEYLDALVEAGIDQKQAKAIASGFSRFYHADFVTKEHLSSVISGLENRLIKWMIGSFIAFAVLMLPVIQINTSTTNERMTTLEKSIDQRMTTLEKAIDQNREAINQNREVIHQNQILIQKVIDHQLQAAQNR